MTILIAKGGRKLNTKLASKMVTMLADSITTSTLTAARQTLSRKMQSTIYRGKARSRATEKRHFAFDNMQKMEEMAEDRRRKWQRNNKGSGGSYRPTGIRPPGGGPRFGTCSRTRSRTFQERVSLVNMIFLNIEFLNRVGLEPFSFIMNLSVAGCWRLESHSHINFNS